jgi:hypothetical protein
LRDDGAGPEKITAEIELRRVRRLGLRVFLLALATAAFLTALLFTAR